MSYRNLFDDTLENHELAIRFKNGDEQALAYFYTKAFKPLVYFGCRYLNDEFTVCTIVQEAILKLWQQPFREKIESIFHAYCFIRINIRWRCLSWHKNKRNEFLKHIYCDEHIDRYAEIPPITASENGYTQKKEELLQAIDKVIPLLPPNQENIMRLYLNYGYSYKEMAKRYTTSNQRIAKEINKSIERVKKIINAGKPAVISQPTVKYTSLLSLSLSNKNVAVKAGHQNDYGEVLDGTRLQIFRYRYEQKMSFGEIAERISLPICDVQQEYLKAHEIIKGIKERRKHRSNNFKAKQLSGNYRSPIH